MNGISLTLVKTGTVRTVRLNLNQVEVRTLVRTFTYVTLRCGVDATAASTLSNSIIYIYVFDEVFDLRIVGYSSSDYQ